MATDYVTFLLDLTGEGDNRAIRETVRYRRMPKLRPKNAFQWKVTCDARGKVIVEGLVRNRPEVIATARWHAGSVAEHKHLEPTTPTGYQWNLVEVAVREELTRRAAIHDRSGEPPVSPRDLVEDEGALGAKEAKLTTPSAEVLAHHGPTSEGDHVQAGKRTDRRHALIGFTTWVVVAAIGFAIYKKCSSDDAPAVATTPAEPHREPAPPPPPPPPVVIEPVEVRIARATTFAEAVALARPAMTDTTDEFGGGAKLFATYAAVKLRWADVDVPSETSVGHVLKDADVERGKRMCADGVIETIERRDLERRKVYVGALRVADSDTVVFVAVGTTGELVKRNTARFCGVVIGKAGRSVSMVGMFDLPENRTPIVEQ